MASLTETVALGDLVDAVCETRADRAVLALGPLLSAPPPPALSLAPRTTLVGAAVAAEAAGSAATVIGAATADALAAAGPGGGLVLLTDGAGRAALASAARAVHCGPRGAADGLAMATDTTCIGGAPVPPAAGAVTVADGAGRTALHAAADGGVWLGPASGPVDPAGAVRLGGGAGGGGGHGHPVVLADGSGRAAFAAAPADGNAWFGPDADAHLAAALLAAPGLRGWVAAGGGYPSGLVPTGAAGVALCDGAGDGRVFLHAEGDHVGVGAAVAPDAAAGATVLGPVAAAAQSDAVVTGAAGDGTVVLRCADARGVALLGPAAAAAGAAPTGTVLVGAGAGTAAAAAATEAAVGVSAADANAWCGLYANPTRLFFGSCGAAGPPAAAGPGVWIGGAAAPPGADGAAALPVTLSVGGAVRWRSGADGAVGWRAVAADAAADVPARGPAAQTVCLGAATEGGGSLRFATARWAATDDNGGTGPAHHARLGRLWPPEAARWARQSGATRVWDAAAEPGSVAVDADGAVTEWRAAGGGAGGAFRPPETAAAAAAVAVADPPSAGLRFSGAAGCCLVFAVPDAALTAAPPPPQLSESTVIVALTVAAPVAGPAGRAMTVLSRHPAGVADAGGVRYRTALELVVAEAEAGGGVRARIVTVDDAGRREVAFTSPTVAAAGVPVRLAYRVAWNRLSVFTDDDGGKHSDGAGAPLQRLRLYDPPGSADAAVRAYAMADANRYALSLGARLDAATGAPVGADADHRAFAGDVASLRVLPYAADDAEVLELLAAAAAVPRKRAAAEPPLGKKAKLD